MIEKIKKIFSEILEVKIDEINNEFGPDDTEMWDSMNNLRLITAIEEEFNVRFSMNEIEEMLNFGMVLNTLNKHLK
ncbi:MAG: acyl carrier protein [Desulfuromonadales bacterium]|nr:acyl carrier protein [Desulfuromonadales bacterium]